MLLRHDPTYYFATRRLPAELRPRHARAVRLRAHGGPDRRRAAPRGHARRAPRRARRVGGGARGGHGVAPADRARAGRRRRAPPAPARRAAHLHALDADRLRRRSGSAAGTSWSPTWTARPARSAGSWPRCSASRPRHHDDLGRLGLAFQLANFIRDVREDRRLDRVYLPAEDRARFGVERGRPARGALDARGARAARARGRARAPPVRGRAARDRLRARLRAPGRAVRDRPLRPHARPRRVGRLRRARPPRRRARLAPARAPRSRRCGETRRRCAAPSGRRSTSARTC